MAYEIPHYALFCRLLALLSPQHPILEHLQLLFSGEVTAIRKDGYERQMYFICVIQLTEGGIKPTLTL